MTLDRARTIVLDECGTVLMAIDEQNTEMLVDAILSAERVFFVGVGRVLLALQAFCKRLAHLGIDAHYVGEITEPAISDRDLLIVGSGSGESLFPVAIANKAKHIGASVAWLGANADSTIARLADHAVRFPVQTKLSTGDGLFSAQPMTSLFEQSLLLFGDMVAMIILDRKDVDLQSLWRYHANLE